MFRLATPADVPAVARIYHRILTLTPPIGWQEGVYPTEATALTGLRQGDLYILEEEGLVIAAARINSEQVDVYANCPWLYPAEDHQVLVLHTLVVDPDCQGKGCATRFVAFYEELARARGCTVLRIDTNAINSPARKLYKGLGFREAAILPCVFNGIPDVQLVCLEKSLA